jgi:RHS repeat-associated protein
LTNLHGDVVATCGVSATAPPPSETLGSDEFGVPEGQTQPPKYGWLGAKQRRTELDSGVIQMGVRTYVPTLGRFLQVDPVPGGSANSYDYANGDPVNAYDLTGQTCSVVKKQASKNKKTKRISVVFGLRCSPHTHWHVVGTIRRRECISDVVPYPERKCPSDPLHKAPGSFFDTSSPVTTKPLKGKGSTYIRMSFDGCDDKWTYFGLLYYADERGKRHPVKTNDVTC